MNTTIRKIGNSEGVILPKEILDRLNLKAGDQLHNCARRAMALLSKPVDRLASSGR